MTNRRNVVYVVTTKTKQKKKEKPPKKTKKKRKEKTSLFGLNQIRTPFIFRSYLFFSQSVFYLFPYFVSSGSRGFNKSTGLFFFLFFSSLSYIVIRTWSKLSIMRGLIGSEVMCLKCVVWVNAVLTTKKKKKKKQK